jgi:MFS family permease
VSGAPPAVLAALQEPHYRRLWLAGLCVNTARWLDFLVLGWLALELTDSPLMVGLAAFCRAAPMMALGPVAGLVADRFDRGRVMIAVQALNLTATTALLGLFSTGAGRFGHLVLLEIVLGVAWAIDFPSRRTAVYTLVGASRLTNAVSLDSVSMTGTKVLGPVVGGLLLARLGVTACYVVLVALYALTFGQMILLTRRVRLPGAAAGESIAAGLAAGLREVRAQPAIQAVLLITVLMNGLVFPYQHILSVFARDVLAVGPARLGLLVSSEGLGALLGSLVIASGRGSGHPGAVFALGSLAAAALVLVFALSPWFVLSLLLQFAIGLAEAGFGTMQSAIVLLTAPERLRGRVMGLLSACIGTQPIGALWIGLVASLAGAQWAAAAGAGLAVLLMAPVAARMATREPAPIGALASRRPDL